MEWESWGRPSKPDLDAAQPAVPMDARVFRERLEQPELVQQPRWAAEWAVARGAPELPAEPLAEVVL
jgi:hypothetical protein